LFADYDRVQAEWFPQHFIARSSDKKL